MATEFINGQWRIPNSWNVDESNQGKVSNYSMKFNGTSDSVNVGLIKPFDNDVSNFAISYWIKADFLDSSRPYNGALIHLDFRYNGANRGVAIESSITSLIFYTAGGLGYNTTWSTPTSGLNNNEWNHIVLNFDGSIVADADKAEFWINGSKKTSTVTNPGNNYIKAITGDGFLGNGFNPYPLEGKLDQFCTFDYTLSSSQIATLYGNNSAGYFQIGNPMALTPNPVVFYPLGDQDLIGAGYNGANWLVPNQVAAGGDVFQSVPLRTTNTVPTDTITSNINYTGTPGVPDPFTVSFWMKDSVVGNSSVFFDHDASAYTTTTPKGAFVYFAGGKVLIYLGAAFWRYYSLPAGVNLTDSDWRNIVVYMDPASISLGKVWIDGTPLALSNGNPGGGGPNDFTAGFRFYLNNFGSNVMYFKDYEIDNAGATLLYNNGAPLLDTSTLAQAPDHWWKLNASDTFDIATSTWTINDHIGSENGTSVNMDASNLVSSELPNTGGRQGYSPYAIELNGTDQNFDLGTSLSLTNELTISSWININNTTAGAKVIVYKGSNSSYEFALEVNRTSGKLSTLATSSGPVFTSNTTLVAGSWYHAALTKTIVGATITYTFFLNGQPDGTGTTTLAPNYTSGITAIGKFGSSSGGYFNGKISNLALWNSGLSSSQIDTIYNNGIPGDISSLNPLAWWELGSMMGFNGSDTYTALSNTDSNFAAVSTSNMAAVDVVNGPGYSNGGSGTSSLVIEKQAPYSFNNALSESMAISNRDDSQASDPYPMIIQLDLSNEVSSYTFISPIVTANIYPYTVDWGDGNIEQITSSGQLVSGRLNHVYDTDTYPRPVIQFGKFDDVGQFRQFLTNNSGSRTQMVELKQWGQIEYISINFYGAGKFKTNNSDIFKLKAGVNYNLTRFAQNAQSFNPYNWNETINTSQISTLGPLTFYNAVAFNQDMNKWDTSSIRSGQSVAGIAFLLYYNFYNARAFNGNIDNWYTTRGGSAFNNFYGATVFNRDISTKAISAAASPTGQAYVAWNMENITSLGNTFYAARAFNGNISNWNTNNVTNLSQTFYVANSFNRDINTKIISAAASPTGSQYTAWDTTGVTTFYRCFYAATVFNQNLQGWNILSVPNNPATNAGLYQMFSSSGMSINNYTDTIVGFAVQVYNNSDSPSGINMGTSPTFDNTRTQNTDNDGTTTNYSTLYGTDWPGTWTEAGSAKSYLEEEAGWTNI